MNFHSSSIIAISCLIILSAPVAVEAQSSGSNRLAPSVSSRFSKNTGIAPAINPLPSPPITPSGPIWIPSQRERYLYELEQYRKNLEMYRKNNGASNKYLQGIQEYRSGVRLYQESVGGVQKAIKR